MTSPTTTGTCNQESAPMDGLSAATEGRLKNDLEKIERTCPNCGAQLDEERCKLKCPKCSYFKSCSDF